MGNQQLQQVALEAFRLRRKLGFKPISPVDPYKVANSLGIEVRFVDIPSMEGMYIASPPTILIPNGRPRGRQRFACAHEVGHHQFRHGTQLDEYLTDSSALEAKKNIEEQVADIFAICLLMPEPLIKTALKTWNLDFNSLSAKNLYQLGLYLGVGYSALLNELRFRYKMLPFELYDRFRKASIKDIKSDLARCPTTSDVYVIHEGWGETPIDLFVGDFVKIPDDSTINGRILKPVTDIYKAQKPGIVQVSSTAGNWGTFLRVSKANYTGLAKYRHLEEED